METDWAIGQLLDWLENSAFANNTLIVYSTDHGDMMATHNGMQGKGTFYEEAIRVPLIFSFPGVLPVNKLMAHPVSTIDIAPTVMDILVKGKGAESMQGVSLFPLMTGQNKSSVPTYSIAQWGATALPTWMVRNNEFKLMMWEVNSSAVDGYYDLKNDPHELNNLIGNNPNRGKYIKAANTMKAVIVNWLKKINSPSLKGVVNRQLK
jgi:arylsulfatase A-like enzyme